MKKKDLRRALICGLALSTMSYSSAFAEDVQYEAAADDLGEVVVTAERVSSKKLETPANVVVISDKEIADNHYEDLAEALENISGVNVSSMGGGQLDYITINGDSRVVLLVDGQRMNNDQGSIFGRASVELNIVPILDNVQRIEVVKGGASALYGSDAVGGVINVITKKAHENKTAIDINAGSFDSHNLKITHQGNSNKWDWFAAGSIQRQGDFKYKDFNGNNHNMTSSGFSDNKFSLALRNNISDNTSATLKVDRTSIDADAWSWSSWDNAYSYGNMDALYTNVSLTYGFKEDKEVPAYVRYFNNYKSMYLQGAFSSRTQGIDYQDGWKLNDQNTLIAGAEYHWSSNTNADGGDYNGAEVNNLSFYLQDKITLSEKWLCVLGVRMDKHNKFGTYWSPKVALNYKADDKTNIYANWGKVFKAPTADDLFYQDPWGYTIGNPDLKPESGWTASLGMNHRFDKKNSMDVSFFKSDIKDAITWSPAASGVYYATNVDRENKQGMELNFKSKLTDNWTVSAGYSYTHIEKNSQLDLGNPKPNGYRLDVSYKNRDFKANLQGVMANGLSEQRFAESRSAIFNFNATYKFSPEVSVYFKALNFTNQHVSAYNDKYYPAPGRFFQIGATFTF